MELKIVPEDISKMVAEAILKSSLSAHITEGINNAVKTDYSGGGIVADAVKSFVRMYISDALRDKGSEHAKLLRSKIDNAVKTYIESEVAEQVIEGLVRKMG